MVLNSGNISSEWLRRDTPLNALKKVKKPTTYSKQIKRRTKPDQAQVVEQAGSPGVSQSSSVKVVPNTSQDGPIRVSRPDRDAFDVPSSEEDYSVPVTPANRPPKKQKLSTPSSSGSLPRLSNLSRIGGNKTQETRSKTDRAKSSVALSSNEFEVPDSDHDNHTHGKMPPGPLSRITTQKPRTLGTAISRHSDRSAAEKQHKPSFTGSRSSRVESYSHLTAPSQKIKNHLPSQTKDFVRAAHNFDRIRNGACASDGDPNIKSTGSKPLKSKQIGVPDTTAYPLAGITSKKVPVTPHERRVRASSSGDVSSDSEAIESIQKEILGQKESATPGTLDFGGLYLGAVQTIPRTPSPDETLSRVNQRNLETPGKWKLKDRLAELSPSSTESSISADKDSKSASFSQRQGQDAYHELSVKGTDSDDLQMSVSTIEQNTGLSAHTPGRGKVTYGRQRSHLAEQENEDNSLLNSPIADFSEGATPFRRKLGYVEVEHANGSISADDGLDSEAEGLDKPLRNVHELRAAGKMRRAAFESDALLEDVMTATSLSLRRGAVFRLGEKLLDKEFREDFIRNGQLSRFYNIADLSLDQFASAALFMASSAVLPLIPVSDFMPRNSASALLNMCVQSLNSRISLIQAAKARSANMSKIHQSDFQALCSGYIRHENWCSVDQTHLSGRILAIKCLDVSTSQMRHTAFLGGAIERQLISELAKIANAAASVDSNTPIMQLELSLSLSVLESLSLTITTDKTDNANLSEDTLEDMIQAILATSHRKGEKDYEMSLVLRLCLNITTNSECNARYLARNTVISAISKIVIKGFQQVDNELQSDQRDSLIDNMVLGLGFLTNLVEKIDENRTLFLDIGPDGSSCLDKLLEMFHQKYEGVSMATTESETKISVTFGYNAVLICCLSLNSAIRRVVGDSFRDDKLTKVRNAMAQFILLYRTISADEESRPASGTGQQSVFVERMEEVLRNLTLVCRR